MTEKPSQSEIYAQKPHILMVDDDKRIRELVSRYLHEHDFVVLTARDAAQAAEMLERFAFDVLVVDVMMPGQDGLDFTRALRAQGRDVPVLLLTALGEAQDRISGLEAGADDYLPKPFEPRELILRLHAILRRTRRDEAAQVRQGYRIGNWRYDPAHDELENGEAVVRLTSVEGTLLRVLAENAGAVMSREDLAAQCGLEAGERTIDVQVTRLRRKIEENTKSPRFLQTVRGKGYLLRAERL